MDRMLTCIAVLATIISICASSPVFDPQVTLVRRSEVGLEAGEANFPGKTLSRVFESLVVSTDADCRPMYCKGHGEVVCLCN